MLRQHCVVQGLWKHRCRDPCDRHFILKITSLSVAVCAEAVGKIAFPHLNTLPTELAVLPENYLDVRRGIVRLHSAP
jgi:hypothetical protein